VLLLYYTFIEIRNDYSPSHTCTKQFGDIYIYFTEEVVVLYTSRRRRRRDYEKIIITVYRDLYYIGFVAYNNNNNNVSFSCVIFELIIFTKVTE